MKHPAPHPLTWLVEPLQENPSFENRAMFGARAIYFDGRMVLCLAMKEEPWRGVLVPTERENHAALRAEFPVLTPHPILPKWLYLPESTASFETVAMRLVGLIRALDPRLGIVPPAKRPRAKKRTAVKMPVKAKLGRTSRAGRGRAGKRSTRNAQR